MSISEINKLYFQRLELVDRYVGIQKDLESRLNLANLCISKAKTTRGVTLYSVSSINTHELIPTVFVDVHNKKFSLVAEETKSDEKVKKRKNENNEVEEENEKKLSNKGVFKPFGILEPSSARDARNEMNRSLQIVCELASIKSSLNEIDEKIEIEYKKCLRDDSIAEILKSLVI